MTQTDLLISGIRQLCERPVSADEFHQIKRCMLDWVGVSCAGASLMRDKLCPLLRIASAGPCSSFITEKKLNLLSAAFLNGYVSHVLELDDGHRFGMLHLESPIFSALLAVAQFESLDFEHFVMGVLVGYQTTVQLARRIQPEHKKRGYHGTGTCGTIGVACAIAVALDFSDSQLEVAIGAATTRAAGLLSALDSPSEIKPYNVAGAVEAGIMSAYLGRCGVKAQSDPIDGKRGFIKIFAKDGFADSFASFGCESEILNIYFKPYAACRHCHAPVECALVLKEKYRLEAEEIEDICVETYRLAIDGHDHKSIPSAGSAKMSIPYCVAVSVVTGSCGMDAFDGEMVKNDDVIALAQKVRVEEDLVMTSLTPGKRGARVTVITKSGNTYMEEVDNPLGEPEHPMSDEMLESKYWDMMNYAYIDKSFADTLFGMIWNIETRYNELIKFL